MNEIYLYKRNNSGKNNIDVGLAYPSTYFYGMSVLGYLNFFKELDINPNVSAQRIFTNTKNLAFDTNQLDLFGFSCVFELDILQILKILKKYNFKIEAKKRRKKFPLIFAGGPVITSNPEPFCDFFDFMIIGDGEGIADKITDVYIKNKHKTKAEILYSLSKIEGIYVPSLYNVEYDKEKISSIQPINQTLSQNIIKRTITSKECLYSPIISENTFYSNTVFIEIARGCPYECKFCSAHWQNKPLRFYDIEYIKTAIKNAVQYSQKIVFIGAMITAHPNFEEICSYIQKLKERYNFIVEFSSMDFANTNDLIPKLLDEKTISLSVECGSEILRKKTGKILTNKQIEETIDFYISKGITKFNLYFMLGVPHETEKDIDEYIKFSKNLAVKHKNVKFYHIISSFTPKPFTPYEREKRQNNSILKKYMEKIKSELTYDNIEINYPMLKNDNFNALISLGDRRLGKYIKYIFEKNVPVKDMLKEYKKFIKIYNNKSSEENQLPHYSKYIYRIKNEDKTLPWSHIYMLNN